MGLATEHHLIPPVTEQPQYNMFHRKRVEVELASLCRDHGLGLTTWSPLYYGILSGKYNQGIPEGSRASLDSMGWVRDRITDERIAIVRQLSQVAEDLHISTAQLAIAWLLRRKEVGSVITGATNSDQLQDNLAASEALEKLTDTVLERIERILGNYPDEE
jgi:aryl-alcohol dehydrogenase-like predicted oxidoreductase